MEKEAPWQRVQRQMALIGPQQEHRRLGRPSSQGLGCPKSLKKVEPIPLHGPSQGRATLSLKTSSLNDQSKHQERFLELTEPHRLFSL